MREIKISADCLVSSLLALSERETVCLLDSCGVSNLGSRFLIAGIKPLETYETSDDDAEKTLEFLDEKLSDERLACIFTIAYEFGLKLEKIPVRQKEFADSAEPDVFLAAFDCLIVHDYKLGKTHLTGNEKRFHEWEKSLKNAAYANAFSGEKQLEKIRVASNFSRAEYLQAVEKIQEFIRRGDTYQTNLTQQLRAELTEDQTPQKIFFNLRKSHPAPFAAFLRRENDSVVSISPERFFKVSNRFIETSPIKGTRPRGKTPEEDLKLKKELLSSAKDLAENTMIVDLLRNDLGRICEFGSVRVEKLCDLETHPTLFHLVSTVRGKLRENIKFSDVLRAVFPCGSITGAPKISTMRIIDELETAPRGVSMGAIGYAARNPKFNLPNQIDMSVAIRTMTIKNGKAVFNVGGGIVIDSDAEAEYAETLTKAKAILEAINGKLI